MGGAPLAFSPRQEQLLSAGVRVVAHSGLRGLTHRAVDAEAGLPQGSCSAYMRTRLALLTRLTDRELQVFQLLGSGNSTREIAERLKISPKTVETYREHLKQKLRLSDGAALMRTATLWVEKGQLDDGPSEGR